VVRFAIFGLTFDNSSYVKSDSISRIYVSRDTLELYGISQPLCTLGHVRKIPPTLFLPTRFAESTQNFCRSWVPNKIWGDPEPLQEL